MRAMNMDVRERRHTRMQDVLDHLDAVIDDCINKPGDIGAAYYSAARIEKVMADLRTFTARDLLPQRKVSNGE